MPLTKEVQNPHESIRKMHSAHYHVPGCHSQLTGRSCLPIGAAG